MGKNNTKADSLATNATFVSRQNSEAKVSCEHIRAWSKIFLKKLTIIYLQICKYYTLSKHHHHVSSCMLVWATIQLRGQDGQDGQHLHQQQHQEDRGGPEVIAAKQRQPWPPCSSQSLWGVKTLTRTTWPWKWWGTGTCSLQSQKSGSDICAHQLLLSMVNQRCPWILCRLVDSTM